MRLFLHKFLYLLQGRRKALILILFLYLFTSFAEVMGIGMVGPFIAIANNPNIIQQNSLLNSVYLHFNFNSSYQFLTTIGVVLIALFYLKSFMHFSAQKYVFEFGFSQQVVLCGRLMKAYLRAPYTFHLDRNSASLIQNITSESERFASGLMMPLLTSVSNSIVILTLVVLLIITNALATVLITGVLLLSFIIVSSMKNRLQEWGRGVSETRTEMLRLINHGLGGLKETKVIGCEDYFESQFKDQSKRYGKIASLATIFSNLPRYLIEAFLITFLILFTFIFLQMKHGSSQDLSSVLGIFALASIRLLPAVGNLISSANGIRYNTHSLDVLYFDLFELECSKDVNYPKKDLDNLHLSSSNISSALAMNHVFIDKISYEYPNASKKSLEEVSLKIRHGESIGIIGKSGAGKTTLVDVILGLLRPQSGDIKVDGKSIYSNPSAWQSMVGYVPQSIFLIDDTLERNIAFGVLDDCIDRERLDKAIQAAQLSEFINNDLPHGLQTVVGERGILLSGGQRQRIGIARALYHERELLVFDEATAALDNETESLVTEAIRSLSGKKTMIIIAHRLSTIEHCDHIYMMESGRIIKSGTYQEVVLNNK